jgi:DNA-directed RNA polymerase alpha subunit
VRRACQGILSWRKHGSAESPALARQSGCTHRFFAGSIAGSACNEFRSKEDVSPGKRCRHVKDTAHLANNCHFRIIVSKFKFFGYPYLSEISWELDKERCPQSISIAKSTMEAETIIDTLLKIEEKQPILISIQALGLSNRVRHGLLRSGLGTVSELIRHWKRVYTIKNVGHKSVTEISKRLEIWYSEANESLQLGVFDIQVGTSANKMSTSKDPEAMELPLEWHEDASNVPIEVLDLSIRAYNSLKRRDINTVDQIYQHWDKICLFKNVGPATRADIRTALASLQIPHDYQRPNNELSSSRNPIGSAKKEKELHLLYSIDRLELSYPLRSLLKKNGINTVDQLTPIKLKELKSQKIIALPTVIEIERALWIWLKHDKTQTLRELEGSGNSEDQAIQHPNPEKFIPDLPIELLDLSIDALDLPIRAYSALKRCEVQTIYDFYRELSKEGSIRGLGPLMLQLIQDSIDTWQSTSYEAGQNSVALTPINPDLTGNSAGYPDYDKSLLTKPIYHLQLSGELLALLKKNNIHTINQLTIAKLQELKCQGVINLSQKVDIQNAIHSWLGEDPLRQKTCQERMKDEGSDALPAKVDFEDYFNVFLDSIDARWISILEFRYGLRTGEKETLEETAAHLGITRERVRQIETLSLKKLKSRKFRLFQSQLFDKIQAYIDKRGGFISELRLVEELNSVLALKTLSMKGILRFIRKLFDEEVRLRESQVTLIYLGTLQGWTTNHWDEEQILHASQKIFDILSNAEFPIQWSDLYTALISEDGLISLDEHLAHAVALSLSDNKQIHRQLDGSWSRTKKPARHARVISVMRELGQAAHFSEIAERYNQIYSDQSLTENAIHGILSGRNEFVRIGRGKYGLREWGLQDDGNIANAIRRILINQNQPMKISGIVDEVLTTWDVSKVSIVAAIDADARFSKTEDGKIWLTEWGLSLEKRFKKDDQTRVDRLYAVLKEFGRPMAVQVIIECHNQVNLEHPLTIAAAKYAMYRKKDLFTYIGSETFALAEWGLEAIEEPSRNRKKEIIDIINEHGPIHINDLYVLYNQINENSPISRNTLNMYLSGLRHWLSRPQRGVYDLRALQGEID